MPITSAVRIGPNAPARGPCFLLVASNDPRLATRTPQRGRPRVRETVLPLTGDELALAAPGELAGAIRGALRHADRVVVELHRPAGDARRLLSSLAALLAR